MRSILKSACLAGLMASMAVPPLAAAPLLVPSPGAARDTSIVDVQYRYSDRDRDGWYRGHRGYRHHRRGYRYHDGWWFPPAAFITGAIIGGALSGPRSTSAHVEWCYDRYRSYRAYDNTYQPYHGPRRQCYSPYG